MGPPANGRALGERLAAQARALGHTVRHMTSQSVSPGGPAITGRLVDTRLEIGLTIELRRALPDLVHVLAFGGDSTTQTAWIAGRLGALAVVSTTPQAVLCDRGDLVHSDGTPCHEFADPVRCALCTGRGRRRSDEFLSRHEMAVGGLMAANLVLVSTEAAASTLVQAGLPRQGVRVVPEPVGITDLMPIYEELVSAQRR